MGAAALVLAAVPTLASCAPDGAASGRRADSRLAPRFDAQHDRRAGGRHEGRQEGRRDSGHQRRHQRGSAQGPGRGAAGGGGTGGTGHRTAGAGGGARPSGSGGQAPGPGTGSSTPAAQSASAGPLTAALTDPRGDASGGLGPAPGHVDVVAASVTRQGSGFTVRVDFAAAPPSRAPEGHVQNVAAFFDLDGDALVDYETWGSLGDEGWSTSYRTPGSARFGADSGVRARPDGSTLVLTFPLSHLEAARSFRWQVGAEWGSYEQVASGTTASDRAGEGGVAFPS